MYGSHAAPDKVHQRETVPVEECAFMESTGFFRDPAAEKSHKLNRSAETNYFYSTVVGELSYGYAHSSCKGAFRNIGPNNMASLLVTENLEVVTKEVTLRENFYTRDIIVLDSAKHIPRPAWQGEGIVTEFGTLALKERRVPCQWQRVRDLTAARIEKSSRAGAELVDEN